jgi:hypothetical protein
VNTLAKGPIAIEALEDESIKSLKKKIEDEESLTKVNIYFIEE